MKFVNYQIPIGLGVSQPFIYSNNHNNVNGITSESKNNSYKSSKLQLQFGGQIHNAEQCETVFYIFEHPIKEEKEDELSVELTDDEALSEEIELSKVDSKEKEDKQSKLIGEITSDRSDMKSSLKELISDIVSNSNDKEVEQSEEDEQSEENDEEEDEQSEENDEEEDEQIEEEVEQSEKGISGKKIRSLKGLFENKSDDVDIENYDDINSHDTLKSILRTLKKPLEEPSKNLRIFVNVLYNE